METGNSVCWIGVPGATKVSRIVTGGLLQCFQRRAQLDVKPFGFRNQAQFLAMDTIILPRLVTQYQPEGSN